MKKKNSKRKVTPAVLDELARMLTPKEVAAVAGVSRQAVQNAIHEERVPSIEIKGVQLVHPDDAEDYAQVVRPGFGRKSA